jgi:hypothetical protein
MKRRSIMVKVKEMPYSEKYAKVLDQIKAEDDINLTFLRENVGEQAVIELKNAWQEGVKPIPDNASFEEKYKIAYDNWIWKGKNGFSLVRKYLGEDGIVKCIGIAVETEIKRNASPALIILKLMRAVSPGNAFTVVAKQMAYQLQWLGHSTISELSPKRAVYDIPHCHITDYPGADDICEIGCQSLYPKWVAKQFKIEMKFNRQGSRCACTLTPLS